MKQTNSQGDVGVVSRRAFLATAAGAVAFYGKAQNTCGVVCDSEIKLSALPYAATALMPIISEQTISFHYGKHHQGYVTTLKTLLADSPFVGQSLEAVVQATVAQEKYAALFNNAAQVWNHTFYWHSLAPEGQGGLPSAALAAAIVGAFGSLDACREALATAATRQFGSGWAWLVAEQGRLRVLKTPNAETPLTQAGVTPLLTLDVWEHAYYLDWQNRRADYAKAVLGKLLNWSFASQNFKLA